MFDRQIEQTLGQAKQDATVLVDILSHSTKRPSLSPDTEELTVKIFSPNFGEVHPVNQVNLNLVFPHKKNTPLTVLDQVKAKVREWWILNRVW